MPELDSVVQTYKYLQESTGRKVMNIVKGLHGMFHGGGGVQLDLEGNTELGIISFLAQ